jgi:hypothetical protein
MKLGLIVAVVVAVPICVRAGTSDVFRVQTTLTGTIQRGPLSNSVVSKVIISADDLVNLAQRRVLGTPVPKNEILALTSDCSTNDPQPSRLIIFDTAGKSNLLTIGTLSNLTTAAYTRRRYVEAMTKITVDDTSDGTNGITGGSFYYHAKIVVPTNGCPTGFSGQWTGFLGTTFPLTVTNFPCTNFFVNVTETNCVPVTNLVFDVMAVATPAVSMSSSDFSGVHSMIWASWGGVKVKRASVTLTSFSTTATLTWTTTVVAMPLAPAIAASPRRSSSSLSAATGASRTGGRSPGGSVAGPPRGRC